MEKKRRHSVNNVSYMEIVNSVLYNLAEKTKVKQ